jgi:hypothetical protein
LTSRVELTLSNTWKMKYSDINRLPDGRSY